MSMYVILQPDPGYGAEVIEPAPGMRQLVVGGGGMALTVQVPARMGGPGDAARFARGLASAALDFAEWCEQQGVGAHRLRESPGLFRSEGDA
ncbi:hypothetical protein GCM10010470_26540 [Saccharopolyspora taberi]|uniref:Uncharacterized protein n=2 Tax=Saccharopolyspora taberi TaxID=60895 RepID=A0ABN3VBZ4_9PSEU